MDTIADGRCPERGCCIWEGSGSASVTFTFSNNDIKTTFVLDTRSLPNSKMRTDSLINGYRIKLVRVEPPPTQYFRPKPQEYKVKIIVKKEVRL